MSKISVVVIACNEGVHLQRTVDELQATLPRGGEILVVDDGSTDGSADFLAAANGSGDHATPRSRPAGRFERSASQRAQPGGRRARTAGQPTQSESLLSRLESLLTQPDRGFARSVARLASSQIRPDGSSDRLARSKGRDARSHVRLARLQTHLPQPASRPAASGRRLAHSPVRLARAQGLGVSRARNWGASQTTGDILVFADAHLTVPEGWWVPMLELLANPSLGAVAPVVSDMAENECKGFGQRLAGPDLTIEWLGPQADQPYQVPLLPGCFWAMRRDVFEAVGGFDEGMIRWATEDTEMSLRLWLLGYELWLAPQVEIFHLFREDRPYQVEWSWVLHNRLRLAFVHFDPRRITGVVEALRGHEDFAPALSLAAASDASARRADMSARRAHSDDWYFRRFGPCW